MNKIIFHIDLDAFFCNVEELNNPLLKTKAFAISNNSKKSVISTCNYIARNFGVKSGMKNYVAKELCPNIIFVKPHFNKYGEISNIFFKYLNDEWTNKIEIASIDECYVDVTNILHLYHDNYLILANKIRESVLKKLGLSISIGISNSKSLSKIACELKKPFAINTLFPHEVKDKLWPLSINIISGIGRKMSNYFNELKIYKVEDFINYNNQLQLEKFLGVTYDRILKIINGEINDDEIEMEHENKSISKSTTLNNSINDIEQIKEILESLVQQIIYEIEENNLKPKNVVVRIKYGHDNTKSKSKTLLNQFVNKNNLLMIANNLFLQLWDEIDITGLAVGISKF